MHMRLTGLPCWPALPATPGAPTSPWKKRTSVSDQVIDVCKTLN